MLITKVRCSHVKSGQGLVEDIRIERKIKQPGTEGVGSVARSLSGREILTITQMLDDDLSHCFDDGFFTFRFISALIGSGKTSLLTYLDDLISIKGVYKDNSVVVRFRLSDLLKMSDNHSFTIKLYCHILALTFWQLLKSQNIAVSEAAKTILNDLLDPTQSLKLKASENFNLQFYPRFKKYIIESDVNPEELFFDTITTIVAINAKFTFVYLIDELDSLQNYSVEIDQTRSSFKALIKKVTEEFNSKLRLFIYLVGTSINVQGFIAGDEVIFSMVGTYTVELNKGYRDEFELIKLKINERIKGAYNGYKEFPQAWKEIEHISLPESKSLRQFCQQYAMDVLAIHEKYFQRLPEQKFEGDARALVKSECEKEWASYLSRSSYKLSEFSTTSVLSDHAFDCYVELLHNGECVAKAYGEAKNYELLVVHLRKFKEWLKDVYFKHEEKPPDLAFLIAPSCPSLLKRKIELANIRFIQAEKISIIPPDPSIDPPIDLEKLSVLVLKELAKKRLTKYSRFKKNELIEKLKLTNSVNPITEDEIASAKRTVLRK